MIKRFSFAVPHILLTGLVMTMLVLGLGIAIPLGGRLRGEVGYLNQYRFGRGGARDQMDHVATFTLQFNIARLGDSGD